MRAHYLDVHNWYDPAADLLQCLECSNWFKHLASHVWARHKIKAADYRLEHDIYKTTPLSAKSLLAKRSETMHDMRRRRVAVVSRPGVAPPQLQGVVSHEPGEKRSDHPEFAHALAAISATHKGKVLSVETRTRLSKAKMGQPAWNKGKKLVDRSSHCERCGVPFCKNDLQQRFCGKSCSMKSSKNWLKSPMQAKH